jgi:hypothetical protein
MASTGQQPYLLYVTRNHVDLEFAAGQLVPEMLAQRRLTNLKLSSYLGLGDTKGRSTLHKRARGIGRHIFGGHFTFPIAQTRDARALYGKWRVFRLRKDASLLAELGARTFRESSPDTRREQYACGQDHRHDALDLRDAIRRRL